MKTFSARIRMPDGTDIEVQVQADYASNALKLLEAQYGAGSVISGPDRVY